MKLGNIHFKSIALRWFFGVFIIIAAAVVVIALALCAFFSNLCFERVQAAATDYAYEFNTLSSSTTENFYDVAIGLADSYAHKNKLEVQVINNRGKVIVSTTGFQPTDEQMTDHSKALDSQNGTAVYRGENAGGEKIMASTVLIVGNDGEYLGAYRWVISLEATYRRIYTTFAMIAVISVAILALCAISGLFFLKSIVKPIREVTNTARKIAGGDFKAKLEVNKTDEIGLLCDTINHMAEELENAETMKNDFISSVSHELRTPLTAIRGWGETAKMSIGVDEELVARGIDVVLSEADRLSGLVEDLLDFSRMQSGRITVNATPIDVSQLLLTVADMYTELAVKQGIELSYNPPVQNSIVMGDPDRLKQVFINIIDNAVKYTEKGGLVLVVQTREEGCVQIQVKDTGVGIPAADIDHVKEKFFKSNKTVRGSGIGLAVADEIIKQHQGLLFIESTEGVGTTATIVLPLYEPQEEALAQELIEAVPEQTEMSETQENQVEGGA